MKNPVFFVGKLHNFVAFLSFAILGEQSHDNIIKRHECLPAISVVKGTDNDGCQVVFTGGGRLHQAAQLVVHVTHLVSMVGRQNLGNRSYSFGEKENDHPRPPWSPNRGGAMVALWLH